MNQTHQSIAPPYYEASNAFLIVEDNANDSETFSEMLNIAFGGQNAIVCVDRFDKVTEALENGSFQTLILDIDLPDQSGTENISQIGQQYPSLPIVVLTGNEDLDVAIDSLHSGAQEYLSKNKVTPEILGRSVLYAKERKKIEQNLKSALIDVTVKNVQLETLAKHDPLTGLGNRKFFTEEAKRILLRAERKQQYVALLYFDLNDFKKINDTYGHSVGDELLKQIAQRLKKIVRESDIISRMGGDEFVIITDLLEKKEFVYPLVKRIQNQFNQPFALGPCTIITSCSIGIAFYPEAKNLEELIEHADGAMYEAKANPISCTAFYSEKICAQYSRSRKIESVLPDAIEKKELTAVFQPIESAKHSNRVNIEACAIWSSETLGNIYQEEFIPIADSTPAINIITQNITSWAYSFYTVIISKNLPLDRISIDVSSLQLGSREFCENFLAWIDNLDIPAKHICLELNDTHKNKNQENLNKQINYLRSKEIKIALDCFNSDDFYSIDKLLKLPFDLLKLDKSLVKEINANTRNKALAAGVIEMAQLLDIEVVATGVDTEEEKNTMVELGCDYLQGDYISKPLHLHDATVFYQPGKTE